MINRVKSDGKRKRKQKQGPFHNKLLRKGEIVKRATDKMRKKEKKTQGFVGRSKRSSATRMGKEMEIVIGVIEAVISVMVMWLRWILPSGDKRGVIISKAAIHTAIQESTVLDANGYYNQLRQSVERERRKETVGEMGVRPGCFIIFYVI